MDKDDYDHELCLDVLRRGDLELIVPTLVIAEVAYFAGRRLGAQIEAAFLRSLTAIEVESPTLQEWNLIADLVERYADFPLGATDASVVVLAERLDTDLVITLDRRHFGALRMSNGRPFQILPE
jgi:predicted nucleic acid-binding protein